MDQIESAELIQSAGDSFVEYLYQLFPKIRSTLEIPSEMRHEVLQKLLCERPKPYL